MPAALDEPSVKASVYTSNSTAALLPQPHKRIQVKTHAWNEAAVKGAQLSDPHKWEVGVLSTTLVLLKA